MVKVQNRVALAMPQLPSQVQNQGITIRKKTPDILMIVNFFSPNERYDDIYLSNYATINVRDELLRVPGVSDITYQGERDYSIRCWLNPQKMAACNITAVDVANAIRNQNLDCPAGWVGQPPTLRRAGLRIAHRHLGPTQRAGAVRPDHRQGQHVSRRRRRRGTAMVGAAHGQFRHARRRLPPRLVQEPPARNPRRRAIPRATQPRATRPRRRHGHLRLAAAPRRRRLHRRRGATTGGGATSGGGGTTGGGGMTGGAARGGASTSSSRRHRHQQQRTARRADQPSFGVVRLRDIADIEMGAQNYNASCSFDGRPSVGLSVYQQPDANALDTADAVRKKMEELKSRFPEGLDYAIGYDITPFIRESIQDVVITMLEAVALVGLVVLIFLQDWKAMVLPMIDVPVSIIGTFAVMAAMGFSLNNISLFGLVLAIGIVVDDAIVVLENIERMLARGHDVRTATIKAMEEVTGPIIAVAVVLCAVFVPCAFLSGITGQFFRQFALTISVSTVISAINAVTMTPSRAVLLFKTEEGQAASAEHPPRAAVTWWHHPATPAIDIRREALPWWIFAFWRPAHGLAGRKFLADARPTGGWLSWIFRSVLYSRRRSRRHPGPAGHRPRESRAGLAVSEIQRLLRLDVIGLCLLRGWTAAGLASWSCWSTAVCWPDLRDVPEGADRIHSAAGPRPADRQHPTARLGVFGAHQGGRRQDREDRAQRRDARHRDTSWPLRAVPSCCRPTAPTSPRCSSSSIRLPSGRSRSSATRRS